MCVHVLPDSKAVIAVLDVLPGFMGKTVLPNASALLVSVAMLMDPVLAIQVLLE